MKSDTPISPDDPRLSAYLLGEMPADESLVFEAQLRQSPEASAELEDLRSMCDLLRDSFVGELEQHAGENSQPTLSVLPAPKPDEKVVAFADHADHAAGIDAEKNANASPWSRPARFASVGALAAAVVTATVILPKNVERPTAGGAQVSVEAAEADAPMAASAPDVVTPVLAEAKTGPNPEPHSRVPNFGYRSAADSSPPTEGGAQFVSQGGNFLTSGESEFQSRSLGSDPTITGVRFLSDDPIDLRSAPLPAELLSYLPADQGGNAAPVAAEPTSAKTLANGGIRHLYLDTEKYPDPEIVHNRVELTGGVFRVGREQTRSLYRSEQRSDPAGRTSVIIKGMVRLEAGEQVQPVVDEPDPSYDFGALSVSWQPGITDSGEIISLPSGSVLKKATTIGSEDASDIAERYVVRLQEKSRLAEKLGDSALRSLQTGNAAKAATQLEVALQLLPEAPATAELREELEQLLRQADAALAP